MTQFTRRTVLTAAAATSVAALAGSTATQAAAPLAGNQAPSFYRSKLGDFEITVVNDGARAIPLPPTFVRNVSNAEVLAAAEAAYMPKGSIVAPFNPIVVNTGAKLTRYDWGKEVAPGITAVEASGHTPGHTAFVIASGSGRLFFQGDVSNVLLLPSGGCDFVTFH